MVCIVCVVIFQTRVLYNLRVSYFCQDLDTQPLSNGYSIVLAGRLDGQNVTDVLTGIPTQQEIPHTTIALVLRAWLGTTLVAYLSSPYLHWRGFGVA